MSTPKTNLVVLLGGGLLAANIGLDPTFDSLRVSAEAGSFTTGDVSSSPMKMLLVGVLTLVALTVISDDSDSAANTILIALVCLWILWLMSYQDNKGGNTTTAAAAAKGATKAGAKPSAKA